MAKIIKALQYHELGKAVGWVKHTVHLLYWRLIGRLSLSLEIINGQKYHLVSFDDYVVGSSLFSLVVFLWTKLSFINDIYAYAWFFSAQSDRSNN